MTLSIITVNLNNCDGLKRTIDSVISQTFTDYEWIVIDGGSTDGSKELIEQYSDHFAYWVSEPDKGIYNAMNKGIKHTKGDYLLFINSGDWLVDENVLKTVFNKQLDGDIIYGNWYQIFGEQITPIKYDSNLSFSLLYLLTIGHCSSFIKRTILFDVLYSEDYEIVSDWKFFVECALCGKQFTHIDLFISYFDSTGISSNNQPKVLLERSKVIKQVVPVCIQNDMNRLDKLNNAFADGQLSEIDALRHKNRFFHRIVTLNLWTLRIMDKLFYRK